MKKKDFLDLLGDIDGDIVEDAAPKQSLSKISSTNKGTLRIKLLAVVACSAIILFGAFAAAKIIEKQILFDAFESNSNNFGKENDEYSNAITEKDDQAGGDNAENAEHDNGINAPGDDDCDVYPDFVDEDNDSPNYGSDDRETTFDEGVEDTYFDGYIPDNGGAYPPENDNNENKSFLLALEEYELYGELNFSTRVSYWMDSPIYPDGIYLNHQLIMGLTDVLYWADGNAVDDENISESAHESVSFIHSGYDEFTCVITVYDNGYLYMFDTFYDVGIDITYKILHNVKSDGVPLGNVSWNGRENCWESKVVEEEKKEQESSDKDRA